MLVLQGGADRIVHPGKQADFCNSVNRTGATMCRGLYMREAQHARFIDADPLRRLALGTVLAHFDCTAGMRQECR